MPFRTMTPRAILNECGRRNNWNYFGFSGSFMRSSKWFRLAWMSALLRKAKNVHAAVSSLGSSSQGRRRRGCFPATVMNHPLWSMVPRLHWSWLGYNPHDCSVRRLVIIEDWPLTERASEVILTYNVTVGTRNTFVRVSACDQSR